MPDVGKNAIQTWDGDGTQTDFTITFSYLDKTDIVVFVDASLQTRPSQWDFNGTSVVRFVTAPPGGTGNVVIQRQTSHPTLKVVFTDRSAISAADLDKSLRQCLFYSEEIEDLT